MTRKIEYLKGDILVTCDKCDNWEMQGKDDARHKLTELPIIEWVEDKISLHECNQCKSEFKIKWE